ncbi:PAS domain-containing protein, partial [bacterium]|nr:PAS domain-containing protein [bacterium]
LKKTRALVYIRAIFITVLFGSFYLFDIERYQFISPASFSYFIAILYTLTIIYALCTRWISKLPHLIALTYVQITLDVITEIFLIYITGGIESMFSFLFPLTILSSGIVLNRRACYIIATLSSLLYGILIDLQFYQIIATSEALVYTEKYIFFNIFTHISAFYLVAFLSGYLSEKLHTATQSLVERDTVLSDLKAFNKYIIDSMPSGVFTTDLNMKVLSFNAAAMDIIGKSIDQVIEKTPEEIFPFLRDHDNPGSRIEGDMQIGENTRPIGMRLSTLKDSAGHAIGLIGVFQDLTDLKAMEAEVKRKEKWAFIGELSASIAHELRNPLASLKGSIEILREKKVSEEQADHLMRIALAEMDRLNGIITDFLLYARPRSIAIEPLDINRLIKDVFTLLKSSETCMQKNIILSEDLNGSIIIPSDPAQLRQVFWNLGLNAVDAVEDNGHVKIETIQEDSFVRITLSDNGHGISLDDIDNIFYPFFTTKEKGTGLGLSIVQKIIEDHGGKISVHSDISGTAFVITLPAEAK